MPKFDVSQMVAPALATGEELLGWVRVNYGGQTEPPALRRTGLAALGEPDAGNSPEAVATFPAHRSMVLALTGARILAYSLGMTGKPKAFVGDVPIALLTGAKYEPGRLGGHLSIDMVSFVNVQLDVAEGDGVAFAAELDACIEAVHPRPPANPAFDPLPDPPAAAAPDPAAAAPEADAVVPEADAEPVTDPAPAADLGPADR